MAWPRARQSHLIETLAVREGQQPMSSSGPIAFDATVVAGLGMANQTIAAQLPQIIQFFPEVRGCHPGSINLALEEPLQVNNPDYTTPLIHWSNNAVAEQFSFLRVQLEHPWGGTRHKAWLYIAQHSPHRPNLFLVEVIAARQIAGLAYGDRCRLHVPAWPHRKVEIIVI
jgi:hypothetical protein